MCVFSFFVGGGGSEEFWTQQIFILSTENVIRAVFFIVFFTVRLQEIRYTTKGLTTGKNGDKVEKVRTASRGGPYKRDERVLKDEDLLQKLRKYSGRPEQFQYVRLEEQQKLLDKFKKGELFYGEKRLIPRCNHSTNISIVIIVI